MVTRVRLRGRPIRGDTHTWDLLLPGVCFTLGLVRFDLPWWLLESKLDLLFVCFLIIPSRGILGRIVSWFGARARASRNTCARNVNTIFSLSAAD
jgi:hypothetical protein